MTATPWFVLIAVALIALIGTVVGSILLFIGAMVGSTLLFITGRLQRQRDDRARRAEMYLELIEIVERHGLWVSDRSYDLLETLDEEYTSSMPQRKTDPPERGLRVRARALTSAYASTTVASAFAEWMKSLEAFEERMDIFQFESDENGPERVNVNEARAPRDAEQTARYQLANAINADLLNGSGLGRF